LIHFDDGGSGMRYFDTLSVGDTIADGSATYVVVTIEPREVDAGIRTHMGSSGAKAPAE
jgi:hypothetical protein